MRTKHEEYMSLSLSGDETTSSDGLRGSQQSALKAGSRFSGKLPYLLVIAIQSFCLVLAGIGLLRKDYSASHQVTRVAQPNWPSRMWSPAEAILEYEIRVFTGGFDDASKTIYQESSDESDKAWERLYNLTLIRIPKSDALLLPNRTYPIKESPGYYLTEFDVFHQLHCLNKIRQALNKERYMSIQNADWHLGENHLSHCIDSIRQSLMCNADVSTIPCQWHEPSKKARPRLNYPHKCVDFEKLWDWVNERRMDEYIDPYTYVDDGLPNPETVYQQL